MMHWVGPQDGLFLVLGGLVVQVLLTLSEAIPTRLSFVGRHLDPTLLTPQEVCNRLTPTVATSSRTVWEAFWTLTTLSSPLQCTGLIFLKVVLKKFHPSLQSCSYPPTLIVFFHSHSLCQLPPRCMWNKKGDIIASFLEPAFLLGKLLPLSLIFFIGSWFVDRNTLICLPL